MNVRMPNGTMIRNVPAGTTKEALATKLNNSSVFTGEKIDVALYLGKGAKTFPVIKAKKQEELIKSGVSETDAFTETGVFNYTDEQTGKVIPEFNPQRFEIDDSVATFNPNAVFTMQDDYDDKLQINLGEIGQDQSGSYIGESVPNIERRGGGFANTPITYEKVGVNQNNAISTLGEVLKHDKLLEAYPQFKNIKLELTNTDTEIVGKLSSEAKIMDEFMGAFYPIENKIVLNIKYFKNKSSDAVMKTLIHEIQHLIDEEEMTDAEKNEFRLRRTQVDKETTARDTGSRMKLTEAERKTIVPFSTHLHNSSTHMHNTINQKNIRDTLIKDGTMDTSNYLGEDNKNRRIFRDWANMPENKGKSETSDEFLNYYKTSNVSKRYMGVGFVASIYNASDKIMSSGKSEQAVWRNNYRKADDVYNKFIEKHSLLLKDNKKINDVEKKQVQNFEEVKKVTYDILSPSLFGKKDSPFYAELETLKKEGYIVQYIIDAMPKILAAESSFGIDKNNKNNPSVTGPMQIKFETFKDAVRLGTLGSKYEKSVGLLPGSAKNMTLKEYTEFLNNPTTGLKNSVITAIGILMVKLKNDVNKEDVHYYSRKKKTQGSKP